MELVRDDGQAVTSGQASGTASATDGSSLSAVGGVPSIVKPEHLEFRDGDLSRRHRLWGPACAMVDLDFVAVEHNYGLPAALVEYKFSVSPTSAPDFRQVNMKALSTLADGCGIPFIVAFYTREPWTFRVFRGNDQARKVYKTEGRVLTEREFVESLYFVRNRTLKLTDQEILAGLDDHKKEAA
jgi:hypothetical protein